MNRTLKDLRTKRRLSVADVAAYLGVSKTAVYNYEAGIARPSEENKKHLAILYETTIEDIEHKLNSIEEGEGYFGQKIEKILAENEFLKKQLEEKDTLIIHQATTIRNLSDTLGKFSASDLRLRRLGKQKSAYRPVA